MPDEGIEHRRRARYRPQHCWLGQRAIARSANQRVKAGAGGYLANRDIAVNREIGELARRMRAAAA